MNWFKQIKIRKVAGVFNEHSYVCDGTPLSNLIKEVHDKTLFSVKEKMQSGHANIYKKYSSKSYFLCSEKSFTTQLGFQLQEVAQHCSTKCHVTNTDKEKKTLGIDLRIIDGELVYEGQLKSNTNTQTGTHEKDTINKLLETTKNNNTLPFIAYAFSKPCDYQKNGIRYIGGEYFWNWIGVDSNKLENRIKDAIISIEHELESEYERDSK